MLWFLVDYDRTSIDTNKVVVIGGHGKQHGKQQTEYILFRLALN